MVSPRTRKLGAPKIAFLLNEQKFRQLVKLMRELTDSENLEYTVGLSDNSSITCESADEVLGIQNSKQRQITSIWIETSYRSDPRIQVKFQNPHYLEPVEYEVSGNEKDVFHSSGRLDEYFSGIRQWYSPVVGLGLKMMLVYVFIVTLLILPVQIWLTSLRALDPGESLLLSVLTGILLVALCYPGLYVLRRRLLPSGTFAIGDGVDRHNGIVSARKIIGGSVILAIVVGLFISWLSSRLF